MFLRTKRLVIFTTNPNAKEAAIILNEGNKYGFPEIVDYEDTICLLPERLEKALKESRIGTIYFDKNGERCELDAAYQGKGYSNEAILGLMELRKH